MAYRTLRSLSRHSSTFASLNGVPTPAASLKCSIWDVTFQRGDGVFEAVRVVVDRDGLPAPRAVSLHLDRLERSASALELPLPPRAHLESWLRDAARNGGEQCINQIVTARPPLLDHAPHSLVDCAQVARAAMCGSW